MTLLKNQNSILYIDGSEIPTEKPKTEDNNMTVKELVNIETIKDSHNKELDRLATIDVDKLSNSDLCFIKMVSASSISTMKKAGRDNEYILTHGPENKGISTATAAKYLGGLDEATLLALGFKKI